MTKTIHLANLTVKLAKGTKIHHSVSWVEGKTHHRGNEIVDVEIIKQLNGRL